METITLKDPKCVEQGKRLAEYNKQKREEFKRLRQDEQNKVQEEDRSKMILPAVLAITAVGVGGFLYTSKNNNLG